MATIHLPPSFRFLGPEGSGRLLTEAWGNPVGAIEGVLGMLVPTAVSPLAAEGWGIVITYDEDGNVDDDGAASIDYARMLKEMQDATVAANADRKKGGFDPITLVGWAEPPSYDRSSHKLYWAKELDFGNGRTTPSTTTYGSSVAAASWVLNAVAAMSQLPFIRGEMRS